MAEAGNLQCFPFQIGDVYRYNIKNWSFRFQSLQNFKQKDELNNVVEGYNTSDLMIGYRFNWGKFNLGIQNLFNTDYQTIWSKRSRFYMLLTDFRNCLIIKEEEEHSTFLTLLNFKK